MTRERTRRGTCNRQEEKDCPVVRIERTENAGTAAGEVELKTHVPRRNACPVVGISIGPHLQERRLWLARCECRVWSSTTSSASKCPMPPRIPWIAMESILRPRRFISCQYQANRRPPWSKNFRSNSYLLQISPSNICFTRIAYSSWECLNSEVAFLKICLSFVCSESRIYAVAIWFHTPMKRSSGEFRLTFASVWGITHFLDLCAAFREKDSKFGFCLDGKYRNRGISFYEKIGGSLCPAVFICRGSFSLCRGWLVCSKNEITRCWKSSSIFKMIN